MAKKEKEDGNDTRDGLADSIAEALNKENKNQGQVAFFLSDEEDPSQIVDWISTGNSILDLVISNRPHGGLPVGRIVELTGLEASGKSLVGAHLLAETQKKGGMAVFIDTETAVSTDFLRAIGVNTDKMLYVPLNTIEDIFDNIESIVAKVRKSDSKRLVTILVDSVAAASTAKEMAADHGADGYATQKAIAISKAMRKITDMIARQRILLVFTNQLRQKMGVMGFGDPWTTSGGKALAFHASVRIRLQAVGQIRTGDVVVGIKTKAKVIKNRMGPPYRSATFNIFFNRGIDNYGNWLDLLMDNKIVVNAKPEKEEDKKVAPVKKKTKKELKEEEEAAKKKVKSLKFDLIVEGKEPETICFEKKDFPTLLATRVDAREFLYSKLCDSSVMKYLSAGAELEDDIEVDTESAGLEE